MSYYDYFGNGRSSRTSHRGGDSHNGSFEQGRTVLPPLTVAFPTSDSPGSSFHVTPTHVPVNSIPFNTVPGSHSSLHPPQQHPAYVEQFRACLTVGKPSLTVLTPNAKKHLPSSKLKLHTARLITIQVHTSSLPTLGTQAVVVRRTTTIEPHLRLTRQTLGGSRHCTSETTDGRAHSITLMITCRCNLRRMTCARRTHLCIHLRRATRTSNP
jgi:hypothetical protein